VALSERIVKPEVIQKRASGRLRDDVLEADFWPGTVAAGVLSVIGVFHQRLLRHAALSNLIPVICTDCECLCRRPLRNSQPMPMVRVRRTYN
jgi:hypothetical protein